MTIFLIPSDYDSDEDYQAEIDDELEIRDYYTEKNVFWVPQLARWQTLRDNATLGTGHGDRNQERQNTHLHLPQCGPVD